MRLFTAILFDESTKTALSQLTEQLREHSLHGKFTPAPNLHLTLDFIGESSRLDAAIHAVDQVYGIPFELCFGPAGRFKRNGGDIYWAGVQTTESLLTTYKRLHTALKQAGFQLEERPYKPHITLGRQVEPKPGFSLGLLQYNLPPMLVSSVSLMKSERINGILTYTPIHTKTLTSA